MSWVPGPSRQNDTQKDGWYYTKDLAYRDEEGYLWYVSRSDDLIKSRAYLISPRVPDDMIGQRIRAYVIPRPGHSPSETLATAITKGVREKIALFKIPKEIVFVETLPRTATGKLMRRELRALAEQRPTAGA